MKGPWHFWMSEGIDENWRGRTPMDYATLVWVWFDIRALAELLDSRGKIAPLSLIALNECRAVPTKANTARLDEVMSKECLADTHFANRVAQAVMEVNFDQSLAREALWRFYDGQWVRCFWKKDPVKTVKIRTLWGELISARRAEGMLKGLHVSDDLRRLIELDKKRKKA